MIVQVTMLIETPDYEGKLFCDEIKELIDDIDEEGETTIKYFRMERADGLADTRNYTVCWTD